MEEQTKYKNLLDRRQNKVSVLYLALFLGVLVAIKIYLILLPNLLDIFSIKYEYARYLTIIGGISYFLSQLLIVVVLLYTFFILVGGIAFRNSFIYVDSQKILYRLEKWGITIDKYTIPISEIKAIKTMNYRDVYKKKAKGLARIFLFLEFFYDKILKEDLSNKDIVLLEPTTKDKFFALRKKFPPMYENNIPIYVEDPHKFKAEVEKYVKASKEDND